MECGPVAAPVVVTVLGSVDDAATLIFQRPLRLASRWCGAWPLCFADFVPTRFLTGCTYGMYGTNLVGPIDARTGKLVGEVAGEHKAGGPIPYVPVITP